MPLDYNEMFICIVAVIAWWFALTIAADLRDGAWRTPTTVFGVVLLAAGLQGTASRVYGGFADMAAVSRQSQEIVLATAMEHAWRPLTLAIAATFLFLILVRNSITYDADSPGLGLFPNILLGGTAICLLSTAAYLLGLGDFVSRGTTLQALNLAWWSAAVTMIVGLLVGAWDAMQRRQSSATA